MKLSAAEAKSMTGCVPDSSDGPAYPYGLTIYLDNATLAKLGITDLPDLGTKLTLHAEVEVTSNSQRQTQDGKTVNMDLQITGMELTGEAKPLDAKSVYPNSLMS